ncbi:MAG: hypothetical protein M3Q65_10385, partial [Chloroflexota bacterium]|nr:hypothetical protein [Chloroflexota bacterium]
MPDAHALIPISPSDTIGLPPTATASATPARHPAAVYLAGLAPGSRRTMRGALETLATLLSGGRHTAATLPWHALRYP